MKTDIKFSQKTSLCLAKSSSLAKDTKKCLFRDRSSIQLSFWTQHTPHLSISEYGRVVFSQFTSYLMVCLPLTCKFFITILVIHSWRRPYHPLLLWFQKPHKPLTMKPLYINGVGNIRAYSHKEHSSSQKDAWEDKSLPIQPHFKEKIWMLNNSDDNDDVIHSWTCMHTLDYP